MFINYKKVKEAYTLLQGQFVLCDSCREEE
jgi:hypothetical protein